MLSSKNHNKNLAVGQRIVSKRPKSTSKFLWVTSKQSLVARPKREVNLTSPRWCVTRPERMEFDQKESASSEVQKHSEHRLSHQMIRQKHLDLML